MGLIVQKFGGTSVANAERLRNVAQIIADTYRQGNRVVAVLSAQGDTTDDLIEKAREINPNASRREMDMLLSTGEQISCALCAMAIETMGLPVVSLTGWQAGIQTNSSYSSARIKKINVERVQSELDRSHSIVIVTGFQGINKYGDVTTLGRGGDRIPPLWHWRGAEGGPVPDLHRRGWDLHCGPRHVTGARKLEEITFDEMLELASLGAQVLHNRSVELAKKYQVNLEVLSSFEKKPGTKVKEVAKQMEKTQISGVAKRQERSPFGAGGGWKISPESPTRSSPLLGQQNINVDIILQSIGRNETQDISFTVRRSDVDQAVALLEEHKASLAFDHIDVDKSVVKVSIVGAGMVDNAGVAAKMFGALYDADINIHMISTSEIKVSVLLDEVDANHAVQAIHDKFFGE